MVVPWHQFHHDVTDPESRPGWSPGSGGKGWTSSSSTGSPTEFEFLGGISVDRFEENIRWLAGVIPAGARVIFLNGAEVPLVNPREPGRHLRHRTMNDALDRVVGTLPNASVCDVRTFVLTEDDVTDSIRHYRRARTCGWRKRSGPPMRPISVSSVRVRRPASTDRSAFWWGAEKSSCADCRNA